MSKAPDFSGFATEYAVSRPLYPRELFAWLADVSPRREAAWDAATGNGQAAVGLAEHFDRVVGTDISEKQIENAARHPRIEYRVAPVEDSGLPPASVDLVTIAAAVHWVDRPRFYDEVRRVARPGGVLAAWTYHVAPSEPPLDDLLGRFYYDVVASYFAPGARLVDDRYEAIVLPGEPLAPPAFHVTVRWTADQVLQFVRTWSGVQAYIAEHGTDPVAQIENTVRRAVRDRDAAIDVRWRLFVRAARL